MVDAKLCCMNSANRLSYPMTKMTFHRPAGSRTSVVTLKPATAWTSQNRPLCGASDRFCFTLPKVVCGKAWIRFCQLRAKLMSVPAGVAPGGDIQGRRRGAGSEGIGD